MEWNDLRFFLAVARSGSLSAAGEKLKASPSTVSRRIEQLEDAIGLRLFSHHQTGYTLTDDGEGLLLRAEIVEDAVMAFEGQAAGRGSKAAGIVRLATAENIANHVIIPALPAFRQQYPEIILELITGIGPRNLTKREADIALRLARPDRGNVTIRKVGFQAYALYGSRDYVSSRQKNDDAGRFSNDDFIVWGEEFAHLPMSHWLTSILQERAPALVTNTLYAQLCAAKAGLGLAVLPCFLGDGFSELERVSTPVDAITQDIWMVVHKDLRASARVRAVADFLSDLIQSQSSRFAGLHENPP